MLGQEDYARAAQEKYDTWVCQNGSPAQKKFVGTKNGSRVRCSDVQPQDSDPFRLPPLTGYPRQTEVQGPPLNVPSRSDQRRNTFSKIFDPTTRKVLVLLIAAFLIFIAATTYD